MNNSSTHVESTLQPGPWVAVVGQGRGAAVLSQAASGAGVGVAHLSGVEQIAAAGSPTGAAVGQQQFIALFLAPPLDEQSMGSALSWLSTNQPSLRVYVVAGVLPAEAERKALYAAGAVSVLEAEEGPLAAILSGLIRPVEAARNQPGASEQVAQVCAAPGLERVELNWIGGSVMLSGAVPTLAHANQLRRDLLALPGVTDVVSSSLQIDPSELSDAELLKRVNAAVEASGVAPEVRQHVHVQVFDGVVSLDGHEPSLEEYQELVEVISTVAGVLDVRSTVTAQRASLPEPARVS